MVSEGFMFKKFILLFLAIQTALPPGSWGTEQPGLDAKLHKKVRNYQLHANNFVEALTQVASDFQIPMGIEWVNTARARTRLDLSWKTATVEEVLQAIVKSQPGYEMQTTAEILRISSPDLVSDRDNPLKLKIETFEVRDAPAEFAWRKLHDAVKRTISPPKPPQGPGGGIAGSSASNIGDPKVSVRLQGETVEHILNALALASARKIWIATFSDKPDLTRSGFRRTLTLWNDFPIPDDEQPVWDFLHWGDPLPPLLAKN